MSLTTGIVLLDPSAFAADPPLVLSVHKSSQVKTICALQTQGSREQSGFSEAEIIHYLFLQGSLFMLGDCIKVMEQNNILSSSLCPFLSPAPQQQQRFISNSRIVAKVHRITKYDCEMWYAASSCFGQHSQGCILRFTGKMKRDKKKNLCSHSLHCPLSVCVITFLLLRISFHKPSGRKASSTH